ncbi:hypothetical protein GH714_031756 [Hevea brasiliensis]|uniref:Uncharacterized protein n=1 Tax=Hevea brasiliensis TaxID=3981 RepID=A0A6A6LTX0_HEVBR|nr:hypothetical protein GH714_031756 [Hevea brasiliensis]
MESENDVASYCKSIQRQRVHIFLAGLDGEFEQIHGEILRKDPVPELEECYLMVSTNPLISTRCDQPGHTKDRCFEIVGYPEWWDHNHASKKRNASKASPAGAPASKTSTVAIVETNAKEDVAEKSIAIVATRGNGGKVFNSSALVSNSGCIIDSGATDHMAFDSEQVSSLKASS